MIPQNQTPNDNMKKIVEKIRQGKQWLISFVMVRTFLLNMPNFA